MTKHTISSSFVVLVGPAGVGKSTIRKKLAPKIKAVSLGPDDFGAVHGGDGPRWGELLDELDRSATEVVECCKVHSGLLQRVRDRIAIVVEVALDEERRRNRLMGRGYEAATLDHLMSECRMLGYEVDIVPDLVVDGSIDPGVNADRIAQHFSGTALSAE